MTSTTTERLMTVNGERAQALKLTELHQVSAMAQSVRVMAQAVNRGGRARVLSLGGGLDSFAMLLDAIGRGEYPDLVVFANVSDENGEDPGEWPSTYRHITEVVMPLCEAKGIEFIWLTTDALPIRGERSLFRYFEVKGLLPGRTSRLCTASAKVERVVKYLETYYGSFAAGVEVWVGFEAGEQKRADNDPHGVVKKAGQGFRVNRFPLIEQGLCRCRCEELVRSLGLPIPRKSACTFCPFSTRGDFQRLQVELPEVFRRIAAMEENTKLTKSGKRLRYGYRKGDGTDPDLATWAAKPYTKRNIGCDTCGRTTRATKEAGCDYLTDDERVMDAPEA